MKTKIELLKLIEESRWKDLPDFVKLHGKCQPKSLSNLQEALAELNSNQQDLLWKKVLTFFMETFLGTFFEKEGNERNKKDLPVSDDEYLKIFESLLKLCILEVKCQRVEKNIAFPVSQHLVNFIVLLGKLIQEFNDDALELSLEICEEWIKNKFLQFERILPNVLLALIEISLKPSGKKKNIDRIWNLRDGLPSLINQISDNCNESKCIKDTLISCASSALFLSSDNGINF